MYLLNVKTKKLELQLGDDVPRYGILSHTWARDEITFRDINKTPLHDLKLKDGYKKLEFVFEMASRRELDYVWLDTCCIDKKSSAELSEAINSMYRYYQQAEVCWVLLSDISPQCPRLHDSDLDISGDSHESPVDINVHFRRSFVECKWFKRGWTLQELLAPKELEFYGPGLNFIGHRVDLMMDIQAVTNIDLLVLQQKKPLNAISIAKRMSWAAHRTTTRPEDRAYSLLGIFGINMPMLYGEGDKAFLRLQEEIVRSSNDHSIFAWGLRGEKREGRLLATSPASFADSHKVVGFPDASDTSLYRFANGGLEIELQVKVVKGLLGPEFPLAILNCGPENELDMSICLQLARRLPQNPTSGQARMACSVSHVRSIRNPQEILANSGGWTSTRLWISQEQRPSEKLPVWIKSRIYGPVSQYGSDSSWDDGASVLEVECTRGIRAHVGIAFKLRGGIWVLLSVICSIGEGDNSTRVENFMAFSWPRHPGELVIRQQWDSTVSVTKGQVHSLSLGMDQRERFVSNSQPSARANGYLELQHLRGRRTLTVQLDDNPSYTRDSPTSARGVVLPYGQGTVFRLYGRTQDRVYVVG